MSDDEAAEFDRNHDALVALRATSEGRIALEHVEAVASSTAQAVWTIAGPAASALGQAGIKALAGIAASMLEQQIAKLGAGR